MQNPSIIEDRLAYLNSSGTEDRLAPLAHPRPTSTSMDHPTYPITMRCGHRTNESCIPEDHWILANGTCPEFCLPCDRARLCDAEHHDRRQLARCDALTRQILLLRGTPDFRQLGAQLQWIAASKAVIELKIAKGREQFRSRWYAQTEMLPVITELQVFRRSRSEEIMRGSQARRDMDYLSAIEWEILRLEGMMEATLCRRASAD